MGERGLSPAKVSHFVRPLSDPSPELAELGGKGASLARLTAAGFPVPDGFCVTTGAYCAYREAERMPPEVAEAIVAAYAVLGSPPVAVRSSATSEDLPTASAAGQQESYLNVRGRDQLLRAVRGCWDSLHGERAVAYRRQHRISEVEVTMAVVVQRLVSAEASGVMFTADPVTGDDSTMVINSGWGLGEAMVGGLVTPDTYAVDRRSRQLISQTVGAKTIMTVTTRTGTAERPVPARRRTRASLSPAMAEQLAGLGIKISELCQAPMDIEWCRVGDRLYILQARPITSRGRHPVTGPDPWNDSRSGDFLWTNTNVGEAIPDVMTPATWSAVQTFLSDAMATASIPPYVGYGRIGGRIYLNVSVMMTLSRAVGVSERSFRSLSEEVFGQLPEDLEIPPIPAQRLRVLRAILPMAAHVIGEARRDSRVLAAYLDAHQELCARRRAEIALVDSGPDLAELWADVLKPEFERVSWMLSAATRSSGASFITTRKRLQGLVGDVAANALTAGLGGRHGQLASLGLLDGLEQLADGVIDRTTFNDHYGHRGPHEFELSIPRPAEDPDWIEAQLVQRSHATADYRAMLAEQETRRDAAWSELERKHPVQALLLHRQLATWAKISRDREHARSEVIRYLWVLRAYVLRAGELTGLGDDIFFCDAAEIVRALNGETISPTVIAERRAAYRAYCSLPPYPALIRGTFDPYAWAADPHRRSDLYVADAAPHERAWNGAIRGFPGSAGVVTGAVRVLHDAGEGALLQPGEVLVTTVTNVGWTPLFPRVAAVVTDVGAPLSHAAIVARELGIPAVVGCGDATMRLRTGDRVRVDGGAGTVEVVG